MHRIETYIEMYKTINNLNPEFMKNLFKVCKTNTAQKEQYKLNLEIPKSNQVFFGTKRLCIQGRGVWNALPFQIKSKDGSKCSCNICFNSNIKLFDYISVWVTLCMYHCLWFVFGRNSAIFSTNSSLLNNGKLTIIQKFVCYGK